MMRGKEEDDEGDSLWARVGQSLRQVFYDMLGQEADMRHRRLVVLALLIDFLQLMSFSFTTHHDEEFNWKHTGWLQQLLRPFGISGIAESFARAESHFFLMGLVYFLCILFLNVYVVFNYLLYNKLNYGFLLKMFRWFNTLTSTVLFVPLSGCLFGYAVSLFKDDAWTLANKEVVAVFVGLLWFLLVGLTTAFNAVNFQNNPNSEFLLARPHSRVDVFHHTARVTLVFFFLLVQVPFALAVVEFVTSVGLAYAYSRYLPYYRNSFNRARMMLSWSFAWTALCTCVATLQDAEDDTAGSTLLYVFTPFILLSAHLVNTRRRVAVATMAVKELRSVYDVELKARLYIQALQADLERQRSERVAQELEDTLEDVEISPEEFARVEEWFRQGGKKFGQSSMLYVLWGCFHFMFDQNRQLGMQQFLKAEERNPRADERFLVWRMRHVFELELSNARNAVLSYVSYREHVSSGLRLDLKTSQLAMEFWREQLEGRFDLMALHNMAAQLNANMLQARSHYEAAMTLLGEHDGADPRFLRQFGQFLVELTSDPVQGTELLKRANEIDAKRSKEKSWDNAVEVFDDRNAVFVISGALHTLGIIESINDGAAHMFGYARSACISKNISMFIPSPFAELHDAFIRTYVQTGRGSVVNQPERLLFARHKSGHLFPVLTLISQIASKDGYPRFLGIMKATRTNDHYMFVEQGNVTCWSKDCGMLFPKLLRLDRDMSIPLNKLMPQFEDLRERMLGAEGVSFVRDVGDEERDITMWLDEINVRDAELDIIRFQILSDEDVKERVQHRKTDRKVFFTNEIDSESESEVEHLEKVQEGTEIEMGLRTPIVVKSDSQPIRGTLRAPSHSSGSSKEDAFGNAFLPQPQKEEDKSAQHAQALRKALVSKDERGSGLLGLRRWFIATMLLLLGMTCAAFVTTFVYVDQYKDQMTAEKDAQGRTFTVLNILMQSRAMELVNSGLLTADAGTYCKSRLSYAAQELDSLESQLFGKQKSLLPAHSALYSSATIDVVELVGGVETTSKMGLHELVTRYVSKAKGFDELGADAFVSSSADLFFLLNNFFGPGETALDRSAEFFEKQAVDAAELAANFELGFLVSALTVLALMLLLVFRPAVSKVHSYKHKVMRLFQKIRHRDLRQLLVHSTARYHSLKRDIESSLEGKEDEEEEEKEENEEEEEEEENEENEEEYERRIDATAEQQRLLNRMSGGKRRKLRSNVLLKISVMFLVCVPYFLATFLWSRSVVDSTMHSPPEINWAGRRRNEMRRAFHWSREFLVARSESASLDEAVTGTTTAIEQTRLAHQGLLYGDSSLDLDGSLARYSAQFDLQFDDACFARSSYNCSAYAHGLMTHGLNAAVNEFLDLTTQLLNTTRSGSLSAADFLVVQTLARTYLNESLDESSRLYVQEVHGVMDSHVSARMALMFAFLALLLLLWKYFYLPIIKGLYNDSVRTRAILLIIPVEVMAKVDAIRNFIQAYAQK